ncbi:hypothetical protein [Streptomyces fructofermentans]|nr:hypothetical protein [Streptomyces fructofermentans]
MYLVHALLRNAELPLPPGLDRLVTSCADGTEGLDHVSVHPDGPLGPVIGLFVTAPSLLIAEDTARRIVERALKRHPALGETSVVSCEMPLATPFLEWLLAGPEPGGQLMPPPDHDI